MLESLLSFCSRPWRWSRGALFCILPQRHGLLVGVSYETFWFVRRRFVLYVVAFTKLTPLCRRGTGSMAAWLQRGAGRLQRRKKLGGATSTVYGVRMWSGGEREGSGVAGHSRSNTAPKSDDKPRCKLAHIAFMPRVPAPVPIPTGNRACASAE